MTATASLMKFPVISPQYKPKLMSFSGVGTSGVQQVSQVICVADTAGSLNNTYFNISSPTANYYVWFNVNSAGTDPAIANKTAVPIALATNASNTTVATAVNAAIDALADFASSRASATLTITNAADGLVTNAANGAVSPGFTITTPTAGVNSAVALSFGKYDAVMTEGSAGPGDYLITFNDPFVQIPQVVVLCASARAPRLVSVSTSAIRVEMNNMSGNPADSDFHMLVVGSLAQDLIA